MGKISGFLKDVVSEMRKVSWPKRKELTRYTIVVILQSFSWRSISVLSILAFQK